MSSSSSGRLCCEHPSQRRLARHVLVLQFSTPSGLRSLRCMEVSFVAACARCAWQQSERLCFVERVVGVCVAARGCAGLLCRCVGCCLYSRHPLQQHQGWDMAWSLFRPLPPAVLWVLAQQHLAGVRVPKNPCTCSQFLCLQVGVSICAFLHPV